MNKKGIVLSSAILLIIFITIAIFGVTVFIAQFVLGHTSEQIIERCRFNAKAGVAYAIYQYRSTGTNYSGTVNIDTNNSCIVSTAPDQASNLVIDATDSDLESGGKNVVDVNLENISASLPIAIGRMILTWSNSRKLQDIRIDGDTVWDTTVFPSPQNIDIADFVLSPDTEYNLTRIRFSSGMSGTTITLSCVMSDGSPTSVCTLYPRQHNVCTTAPSSLIITSTGRITGSTLYKKVVATYNISTGKVTCYAAVN